MKFSFFSSSTQFVQGKSLHQVHQALQDNEPFWLDVYQPTDVDLRLLALIFHIHPLTIEDMLSDDEIREKCELFDKYLFLCLQTFTQEDPFMESFYYLLLFPWCVVSVRFTPLVHPLHVLIRLTTSRKQRDWAPDWIVYAILDDIMDGFLPVIKALEFDVDSIDDLVLILKSNEQEDMLTRIRGASKKVTQFMRLLHFKDEVVKSFSNRSTKYVHQDTLWYVRDIQDHIATLHQALQITKENLHNAHNIYLSQVSVELSKVIWDEH
ncbi:CorA metal ion transporter [Coelomomyces lativittatus]|nr:CorA metal ion transporter [Coelomomyces lativittatus]